MRSSTLKERRFVWLWATPRPLGPDLWHELNDLWSVSGVGPIEGAEVHLIGVGPSDITFELHALPRGAQFARAATLRVQRSVPDARALAALYEPLEMGKRWSPRWGTDEPIEGTQHGPFCFLGRFHWFPTLVRNRTGGSANEVE